MQRTLPANALPGGRGFCSHHIITQLQPSIACRASSNGRVAAAETMVLPRTELERKGKTGSVFYSGIVFGEMCNIRYEPLPSVTFRFQSPARAPVMPWLASSYLLSAMLPLQTWMGR